MFFTKNMIGAGLVAFSILGACSGKKSFAGGTVQGTAAPSDSNPEPSPGIDPGPGSRAAAEAVTGNIFKDCDTSASSRISAELFELPRGAERLPKFEGLTAKKTICLNQLDIAPRNFNEGFPGVEGLKEWFALNIHFNVKVARAGEYSFRVNSDDGSKLFIDDSPIPLIDNDGQHSPEAKDAKITLTAGSHAFNLQYFQGPADQIALELFWSPPESPSFEYIPTSLMSRGH